MNRHWMQRQQQKLICQRQSQEQHRQQESRRLDKERHMQAELRDQERFDRRRFLRQLQQEHQQRDVESALLQAEEERVNRQRQLDQEERIAKELARITYEKQREERMRQHIIENSIELRELDSKLKCMYTKKEIAAQIAEKEAMRLATMELEAKERVIEQEKEALRRKIIEEEKQRRLQLLGLFPKEEMERKVRERLMMRQTIQEQLSFKEMQQQAEKEEEEAFRKMMMAKFAEDDHIEQMNDRKRRMKQLEHKAKVEKLLEDRRRQRNADMELEAKERAIEQEKEALRRKIIEEEKQRRLQFLGLFPKDVNHQDDQEDCDEDFRESFDSLKL